MHTFITVCRYGSGQPYTYGILGRGFTMHTVIYGVQIRFWPTLVILAKVGGFSNVPMLITSVVVLIKLVLTGGGGA